MADDDREAGVSIPESGVKQVYQETGEALIEHCPSISEHEPEDED